MKKVIKWILAASFVAFAAISCAKQSDLDKMSERIDGIDNRLSTVEATLKQLNEIDVPGLRNLVEAITKNVTVKSVVETEDGFTLTFSDGTVAEVRNGRDGHDGRPGYDGVTIESIQESEGGYVVTFSDGNKVFLKNGTNGIDGSQLDIKLVDGVYYWTVDGKVLTDDEGNPMPVSGVDGKDGETPVVGITLVDGIYVWTVNDSVLKDDEGNPIPVAGVDGVTPQFGIMDGHWVVSYDEGKTWKTLGLVSDTDYSAYIDPDQETDDYIVLVVGATNVQIPKEKAFTLTFTTIEDNGVSAGETVAFPYTIAGVNANDETDVDVIGIIGDWTAEVVPADMASGILNITAGESETAKVTVYAANHKGKTDIRTLKFEDGVLEAIIETKDIDWEGGELDLTVKANQAYEIVIPEEAEEWISVAPVTRVHEDNYKINVAKNESGSYRQATLKVVNAKGVSVKDIEVLQYANPEAATELASVLALPDEKAVAVKGVTVVAASKVSTIITDGETFSYVTNFIGTPGTVINLSGVKNTDDLGLGYIAVTDVSLDTEAEPVEVSTKDNYLYFGMGQNGFTYFYTAGNGILSEKDGAYYIPGVEEPQQFVFEDPTQDLSALTGKFVAFSGWVKAVDTADAAEDIITVVTDMRAVTFAEEAAWKVAYEGETSDDKDYPELVTNTVAGSSDSYYTLVVFPEEAVTEIGSFENFLNVAAYQASDEILYYLTYFGQVYDLDYDTAFGYLAYQGSDYSEFRRFDFGKYYAIAIGLDEEGRVSGKYAYTAFEKEDPSIKLSYEDFLGVFNVSGAEWTVSQKENGVSYNIDGIPGSTRMAARGGNTTLVARYDAENGTLYAVEQEMAAYDDPSTNNYGPLKDYFSGYFSANNDTYPNFPLYGDAATVFTLVGQKDGTFRMDAGECTYGVFSFFQFHWLIQTGQYAGRGNTYQPSVSLPVSGIVKLNKVAGKYEDFLGTWKVGQDEWTLTQKEAGKTYTLTGVYGSTHLYSGVSGAIEANFDAETGELYLMDQYLGQFNSDEISAFSANPYGMCSDNVCGIFVYGGSAYAGYPNNGITTPGRILTGSLDASGNVVLAPGECMYATYAALGFSWSILTGANAGGGNYYKQYVTSLPATMVKATAGTSSIRSAKQEGTTFASTRLSASSEEALPAAKFSEPVQERKSAGVSRRLLKH